MSMATVLPEIRSKIASGMVIPKPAATVDFTVKGWGRRRGEAALVYLIPNHSDPARPYEKGITGTEFERCFHQLVRSGAITRAWFNTNLPACAKEGPCNFTTMGGVFTLIGLVRHERGAHVRDARD